MYRSSKENHGLPHVNQGQEGFHQIKQMQKLTTVTRCLCLKTLYSGHNPSSHDPLLKTPILGSLAQMYSHTSIAFSLNFDLHELQHRGLTHSLAFFKAYNAIQLFTLCVKTVPYITYLNKKNEHRQSCFSDRKPQINGKHFLFINTVYNFLQRNGKGFTQ